MQPFTVTEGTITASLHHCQKGKVKKNPKKQQTNIKLINILNNTCIELSTNFILFTLQPL